MFLQFIVFLCSCCLNNNVFGALIENGLVVTKHESDYPSQIQLSKLSCNGFTTGPVLIINKKTFYLPLINNSHHDKNITFSIGNDDRITTLDSDEPPITGSNIYIRLKNNEISINNYQYFNVNLNNKTLCNITIPRNLTNRLQDNIQDERQIVVRKCCNYNSIKKECTVGETEFTFPYDVLDENRTLVTNFRMATYEDHIKCQANYQLLEYNQSDVQYLINGSLTFSDGSLVGPESYCFNNTLVDNNMATIVVICEQIETVLMIAGFGVKNVFFKVFVGISIASAIATVLIYIYLKEMPETLRRKMVIYFAISLLVQYVCFLIVFCTKFPILERYYKYTEICKFFWFGAYQYESLFMVRCYEDYDKDYLIRYKTYAKVFLVVTIITLLTLSFGEIHLSLPQYLVERDYSSASKFVVILYYIFVFAILLACFAITLLIFFILRARRRNNTGYYHRQRKLYQGLTMNSLVILVVMALCTIAEILSQNYATDSNVFIYIGTLYNSLGLLVFYLFVLHRKLRSTICTALKKQNEELASSLNGVV